jgi:hypothetical protein
MAFLYLPGAHLSVLKPVLLPTSLQRTASLKLAYILTSIQTMPSGAKRTRAAAAAATSPVANEASPQQQQRNPSTAVPEAISAPATSMLGEAAIAPPASPSGVACAAPPPPPAPTPTPSKKKPKPLPASPSFKPDKFQKLCAKATQIQRQLAKLYPDPPIPLQHGSAFQLLVGGYDCIHSAVLQVL